MTKASDILHEVSLFESFFKDFDKPATFGVERKLTEAKPDKELSVYIEIDNNGKITRMEPEAFRKSIGGAHSGMAQDWVEQYNKDKGSQMARLVYAKNGKEIGRKVEDIKRPGSNKIEERIDSSLSALGLSVPNANKSQKRIVIKDKRSEKPLQILDVADFIAQCKLPRQVHVTAAVQKYNNMQDSNFADVEVKQSRGSNWQPARGKDLTSEGTKADRSLQTETKDFIKGSIFTEGGPGSGGQYPTQKMKMPLSPFISVGTRKGILKNMPFELETVPLSKITHVAQRKFVPFKVKRLCKDADSISKYPICLLKVPSEDGYHIMDGHHRYLAAIKKGIDSLDARVWVKFEEPKVDEPIAELPPAANEIDLEAIPVDAEIVDVTVEAEPSIESPAQSDLPIENHPIEDEQIVADLSGEQPEEEIPVMTVDQALESMQRCGKVLFNMR